MRILLAIPAYWPAHAFGGPVVVARELVARLVRGGHEVDVVTTTLRRRAASGRRPRTRVATSTAHGDLPRDAAPYRWMGITPTLPLELRRLPGRTSCT